MGKRHKKNIQIEKQGWRERSKKNSKAEKKVDKLLKKQLDKKNILMHFQTSPLVNFKGVQFSDGDPCNQIIRLTLIVLGRGGGAFYTISKILEKKVPMFAQ